MDREKVCAAGVDYDEGVRRFAGKPQIYEKYLLKLFEGHLMEDLQRELEAKDYEGAFRTAHDLKGTSGNLSVNKFYNKVCELVEILRGNVVDGDPMEAFNEAMRLYELAEQAVRE